MRANDKSILFIHHAGKGGNQRGTSKREDILDTVIILKRPDDYKQKDGAIFEVYFEKARSFMRDEATSFVAKLNANPDSNNWHVQPIDGSSYDQVINLAKPEDNQSIYFELDFPNLYKD